MCKHLNCVLGTSVWDFWNPGSFFIKWAINISKIWQFHGDISISQFRKVIMIQKGITFWGIFHGKWTLSKEYTPGSEYCSLSDSDFPRIKPRKVLYFRFPQKVRAPNTYIAAFRWFLSSIFQIFSNHFPWNMPRVYKFSGVVSTESKPESAHYPGHNPWKLRIRLIWIFTFPST